MFRWNCHCSGNRLRWLINRCARQSRFSGFSKLRFPLLFSQSFNWLSVPSTLHQPCLPLLRRLFLNVSQFNSRSKTPFPHEWIFAVVVFLGPTGFNPFLHSENLHIGSTISNVTGYVISNFLTNLMDLNRHIENSSSLFYNYSLICHCLWKYWRRPISVSPDKGCRWRCQDVSDFALDEKYNTSTHDPCLSTSYGIVFPKVFYVFYCLVWS